MLEFISSAQFAAGAAIGLAAGLLLHHVLWRKYIRNVEAGLKERDRQQDRREATLNAAAREISDAADKLRPHTQPSSNH